MGPPVLADPTARRLALVPLLVDGGQADVPGGRLMLGGCGLGHEQPRLGVVAHILQSDSAVVAGQLVRARQPHIDDGEPAGLEMACHRLQSSLLRIA